MTGDFAEIAYLHVLSKRCTNQGSLTIQEINEHLDKIALYNNQQEKELVRIIDKHNVKTYRE